MEIVENGAKKPLNVLLVDDDQMAREIARDYLKTFLGDKCLIKEATNGQEAIELLKFKKFDLVMTDFEMPILNGVDVIMYIAKNCEEHPWIIVMSGSLDDFKEEFADRVGSSSRIRHSINLLGKPFTVATFLAALPTNL